MRILKQPASTPDNSQLPVCKTEGCTNTVETKLHKFCDECKASKYEAKKAKQRWKRNNEYIYGY